MTRGMIDRRLARPHCKGANKASRMAPVGRTPTNRVRGGHGGGKDVGRIPRSNNLGCAAGPKIQRMKNNNRLQSPAVEAAQGTPEDTAAHLARCAVSFGIENDDDYEARVLAIAFVNGTLFSKWLPDVATEFAAQVRALVTTEWDHPQVLDLIQKNPGDDVTWVTALRANLQQALQELPTDLSPTTPLRKILWAAAVGIRAGQCDPEYAETTFKRYEIMGTENRFLGSRLSTWALEDFEIRNPPLIEFFEQHYRKTPVERALICREASETLSSATLLQDPWELKFWSETGFNRGKLLAENHPAALGPLFDEAGPKGLNYCQQLFQKCVLGTAKSGTIDLERAVLRFFAPFSRRHSTRVAALPDQESKGLRSRATGFTGAWVRGKLEPRSPQLQAPSIHRPTIPSSQLKLPVVA